MKPRPTILRGTAFAVCVIAAAAFAQPTMARTNLESGIRAYQERRWTDSMGYFLQVLAEDPKNEKAHMYLNLLSQHIDNEQIANANENRLALLSQTSKRLDSARLDTQRVDQAIHDSAQKDSREKYEKHSALVILARMEEHLGNLESANDLVLRVITEDPSDGDSQRLLSDLQVDLHNILETTKDIPPARRLALEGFYAYGQADYHAALAAWKQVRGELAKSVPGDALEHELAMFHFGRYQKLAQNRADEEVHKEQAQTLFDEASTLYDRGNAAEALDKFHQSAIMNPDYAPLGKYLVNAAADVENARTSRLTPQERVKSAEALAQGNAFMDRKKFAEAKAAFGKALQSDPTNPQAKSYLAAADSLIQGREDPNASQRHYEAGLIAYASEKFDDSVREWRLARSLDTGNLKAVDALAKVEKVIAHSQDVL